MADFYYCLGVWLSSDFMEHTCKKRGNCRYYQEDFFSRYADMLDRFDFLICKEDCKYYAPVRDDSDKDSGEDEDPFATCL